MSTSQYLLSNEVYTFKNAMTWGICKEHCSQVQKGKLSNGASCFHISMAVLEAFPILGQIVSLVEYCVNKIFSCKYSESESTDEQEMPRVLGINPTHKDQAAIHFSELSRLLEHREIFHYRNSQPTLINLAKALDIFSRNGHLDEAIEVENAHGQGACEQPDTVRETFKAAIDPDKYGGIMQTIKSMQSQGDDLDIAVRASAIVEFLKTLAL